MSTAPQITTPPASPNKYGGDPVAFDAAMQAFLDWMAAAAPQMNTQATWLNQRADTVDAGAAAAGSIGASVSTAAASATAAAAARDAALAAWVASTYPAETLASVSTGLHSGAIIKAIVYDTSKDSDGGAWRKRTTHTSWYQEALGFTGKWLGQKTSTATAWATSGAAAGDGFQNSTDGKYYVLTGTSTASEIWRGNVREFPAVVGIVAESARVIIYDLTQPTCPVWMVFTSAHFSNLLSGSFTSVAAVNGAILVGSSAGTNFAGLAQFNFVADTATHHRNATYVADQRMASKAHPLTADYRGGVTLPALVNATVNDVAITVLDTAPIDAATGLPVPTIAVATAGGVSVIKDDGTVVNSLTTTNNTSVAFTAGDTLLYSTGAGAQVQAAPQPLGASFGATRYNTSGNVPLLPTGQAGHKVAKTARNGVVLGALDGLIPINENPSASAKGMLARITAAFTSGWQVGDSRGAWLADTTAETISGSGELITNGTFTTDTSGWTVGGISTLSVVSGKMRVTQSAANGGAISNAMATVVGRTYYATCDFTKTTQNAVLSVSNNSNGSGSYASAQMMATGTYVLSFVATATTTYLVPYINGGAASDIADFDNISVKLAEPDRSVKNKGLIVNGTLTKTAVASGAALVAWSGFSASNYLEQPYNSDLDFGTGDFCVMGWVNVANLALQQIFDRGSAGAGRIGLSHDTQWGFTCSATAVATAPGVNVTTGLHFVVLYRTSGVIKLNVDTVEVYSAANTANVSNAIAPLTIGASYLHTAPLSLDWIALWRITATAPSADQIAHIYRTELPLFQAGAQCTIAGTSTAVTTLAYDEDTTLLHVGTSWGRSTFKDLLRIGSEATSTGALTSLSASGGVIVTGGTSGKVYMPALLLRDELRRKSEARKALGRVPVFFDYTATASQTAFVVPKGYTVKALYKNGTLMRETTTGVYWTRSNDGFQETATLSVGASASDWISLMCVRA